MSPHQRYLRGYQTLTIMGLMALLLGVFVMAFEVEIAIGDFIGHQTSHQSTATRNLRRGE